MIFQALHKFAKEHDLLSDVDFTSQKISAYIALTAEGSFRDVFTVGDKKSPIVLDVSKIPPRNSAAIPALGADTIGRIVPGFDPKANAFAVKTQRLFNDQLKTMQTALSHPALPAVIKFLDKLHDQPELQEKVAAACIQAKLKPSDWLTFKVEGGDEGFLVEWPEVKEWWRQQAAARRDDIAQKSGETSICMVTGQSCVPMRTHGANIKVAPGGLAGGVALVSCDKSAFGSYGFDKALVSPMSEEAVEGYIRAINHLGSVDHHHYRTKETNYLFWSSHQESPVSPAKLIETGTLNLDFDADNAPDFETDSSAANVVRKLFTSISAGNANATDSPKMEERYYCLALSGNSARGIIRGWIDQPLPQALQHVAEWFEDLSIRLDRPLYEQTIKTKDSKKPHRLAEQGDVYNRWPLWQLINSLKGKGDSSEAEVARQRTLLWQCALLGRSHPVPLEVLITACRRIATTGDCPPARAALIQFLVSRILSKENPSIMHMNNEHSDLHSSPAFLSGRLLRILNSIQTKALESVNASLVDKFYAAASATPSSVLGSLVAKSNPHLSKIRSKSPGLAFYFEEQLTEVIGGIVDAGGFKATHSPVEQGQFALGFYFQRVAVKKEKPEADDVSEQNENFEN
jgi:CRISPR-associated protein Csd1